MKNNFKLAYLLIVFMALFTYTGCSSDDDTVDPVQVDETAELVKYLESNGNFINSSAPALVAADVVYQTNLTAPEKQYLIDIRSAEDFAKGHIKNAENVDFGNLLAKVKENHDKYESLVVICYSGQTASYGSSILNLLGYNKVKALKWGMSSWDSTFASTSWIKHTTNSKAAQFVTTSTPKAAEGNYPVINTGKTNPQEILEARAEKVLAEGFGAAKIANADVYQDLNKYYIVNYWPEDHYNAGHIEGSMQYTPKKDLNSSEALKTLPTDKPVVIYCYTGQTSAYVAAYLRLLGYDGKTLLYGVNDMNYDNMPGTKFDASQIKGYPYEK